MNPMSPADASAPALVISLLSRLQGLWPRGQDQGKFEDRCDVGKMKRVFLLLAEKGTFSGEADARIVSSATARPME